ncbi:DUF6538 domain-containing protein [Calidifontimicrobium sp. SYSU G02091]|uniref:DUF6538 domain-containing protein n=1 Tax=Calidifontimicrobium sp. SYSU G02091 TaxID=2926421 RepID=UPI00301562C2
MFRRGRMLYFKRKVPADVLDGFPEQQGGQVWLSLGTDRVEQAKVLLAVEVTEFELRVAELRRRKALQAATRASASGQPSVQPHAARCDTSVRAGGRHTSSHGQGNSLVLCRTRCLLLRNRCVSVT